ncbi:MAG: polyribonucleotide nucleotidyltransferase [Patescibacteria group bacterium]|nr:polyribonucleotide nucleotidyltransferase [Patescibacteria group bacterium]
MNVKNWSMEWGGRTLSVEMGKLALQTQASCMVRYGDTVILATAAMSKNTRDGIDFFPLMVNFEEKLYAAGRIKGSRFIKREGRPSEEAILSGRMVDRAIRPLFDESMRNDTQVILTALSWDGENDSQVPAFVAASIALSISPIPWNGPIVGARVGKVDGKLILNPTFAERANSAMDIVVAGTPEKVVMVEAECKEEPEDEVIAAMEFGAKSLAPLIEFINKIVNEVGQTKVNLHENLTEAEAKLREVEKQAREFIASHVEDWIFDAPKKGRAERVAMVDRFSDAIKEKLTAEAVDEKIITIVLGRVKIYVEEFITQRILEKGQRLDGRGLTDIRDLYAEVGLLPRTHGTGLFQRGDTQVLSVVTLGAPGDMQTLDTMEEEGKKRYMHHYNDTPATYGETGPLRGPGNRAIGHGALAEKALEPVLPEEKDFPYAIRVVSEVLGSNGSSSMASTCGSSLALMDAGVPIKKPVAGVAMGLASIKGENWKIITDLQDIEDGPGGMDFKIAGTADGVTAIQMDTKTFGLSWDIVKQTFKQSREARLKILDTMKGVLAEPRKEMSPYAPRIVTIQINPDKIRDVVGPGGKMINKIIDETGVSIDIEQDGRVNITSNDAVGLEKAIEWVKSITHEIAAGEVYEGTVVRLEDFGAFVNVLPGQDGLVHVTDIAYAYTSKPSDVMKIGDKVKVVVKEIDSMGRVNLSMKALLPKPEGYVEQPPRERRGGFSGGRGGGGRGGRGAFGGGGRGR